MQEWKYHTLELEEVISEDKLALMGRQCWELAGYATHQVWKSVSDPWKCRFVTMHAYYFKQPRELTIS